MQKVSVFSSAGEAHDVPVLVSYRFLKYKFSPWREEAVMIMVPASDQILAETSKSLKARRFANFEILNYLPQNGKRKF